MITDYAEIDFNLSDRATFADDAIIPTDTLFRRVYATGARARIVKILPSIEVGLWASDTPRACRYGTHRCRRVPLMREKNGLISTSAWEMPSVQSIRTAHGSALVFDNVR